MQGLATQDGFSAEEIHVVRDALVQAERIPKLVEAEQKSAERVETWTMYATKRVDAPRIDRGAQFISDHRDLLARAESEYGVAPSVIAGVLGLETNFGRTTGSTRVLDALATQGFEHPTRSDFFFSELRQFFLFCRDFGVNPADPKGSYAGAMGWAQFMPSNYRRLSVDFDGDGRRDLWQAADAIGSVARYLSEYDTGRGWRRGEPLMVKARLTKSLPPEVRINSGRVSHTVAALAVLGIESEISLPPETPVGVIELRLDDGFEYWLGLHNFYSVMSYNPRVYYAMTVGLLAREMAQLEASRSGAE